MARDISAWCARLEEEAKATGLEPLLQPLDLRVFFRVELGLYFLTKYMPGQSATVLRKVLDGYLSAGPGTAPMVRNLRRRMGPTARGGDWKVRLNEYCKLPAHVRMFELDNPAARRVVHGSVFRTRGSAVLPGRAEAYQAALRDPVPYETRPVREPAPAGAVLWFRRHNGKKERLRVPDWVSVTARTSFLEPKERRTRVPFPNVTDDDLKQAAKEMDRLLEDDPRYCGENFSGRLENMVFARVDAEAGELRDELGVFGVDGVAHIVGLMNAGKTTFNDILVKISVDRGLKVGYLVSSVGNALAKVRFFRTLGIRAVPLIGRSTRDEHLARYWDDLLYVGQGTDVAPLPSEVDATAPFTTDMCPLEMLLEPTGPVPEPLAPEDRPCRDTLRVVGAKKREERVDCPLLPVCPFQNATSDVPDAQVWVTTPAALLASAAEPAAYTARWITAVQHELDLLVVDEADQVMSQFDKKFLHHEPLTQPDGWSSRIAVAWHEGLATAWHRPLAHKHGQRFQQYVTYHSQALAGLLPLLMLPDGETAEAKEAAKEVLAETVDDGPFSGYTLLTRLARLLHGIEDRAEREEDSERWEAAEQYFDAYFAEVVNAPFDAPPDHITELIDSMTAGYAVKRPAQEVAEEWLIRHEPAISPAQPLAHQAELARLLIAGIWAARVTTSYFELSAMQETLREVMPLSTGGSVLAHQPHPELRALVPELPMGNMMALQWTPGRKGSGGSLDVLWLRGVGRWLLYHLHDMLACEGVDGPHVLLSSATSYEPCSARYHIDILPSLILREPPECADALRASRLLFRPRRRPGHERGVYVSGAGGRQARQNAVRTMTDAVCTPDPGATMSLLEQALQSADEDRRRALFVVLSTEDAETSAHYMNTRTTVTACHVVPDSRPPGPYGLAHRRIAEFPATGATVMVAPEGSVGRAHNMLNARGVAAIYPIFYLARLHPPPDDLSFPLAVLNSQAMARLLDPVRCDVPGTDPTWEVRALIRRARATWSSMMGRPLAFRTLPTEDLRRAFVADQFHSFYQTTGRGIRGNVPVRVYLLDAAFAPRAADLRESAPDTERTSVLVAGRSLMRELLAEPGPGADAQARVKHAIHTAVWGLLANLLENIDWG
ncbi:pPIWI_RE_Z domain-containing protein [Streptomyces mexicanus]|uniref:pPIWI_RE_Z domain-containing protein n=1 Tax=Streptomyces mexicanus TaxID=178566 RepID=UPI0036A4661C